MNATINGKHYDTAAAKYLINFPSPDGDDALYRTESGEFFLLLTETYLDGSKLAPDENPYDLVPELMARGEQAEAARFHRLDYEKRIQPISHREALVWCIKTQIPECLAGYLLESI